MGEILSALVVSKAAEWFAAVAAYPEDNTPPEEDIPCVKRWLDEPLVLLRARDKVEYTRLFDIGNPEPPAPLMESHYQQDSQARLRKVVTFYRTYGVINETEFPPDHLSVELAFLSFLASLACDYPDRKDLVRAYQDFARVHLSPWLSSVIGVLEKEAPNSAYTALLKGAGRFLADIAKDLELQVEVAQAV